MQEKLITIDGIEPQRIYGSNDYSLNLIKELNPNVKIVGRGNEIRIKGNSKDIDSFESKFNQYLTFLSKNVNISDYHLYEIFGPEKTEMREKNVHSPEHTHHKHPHGVVILYGNDARPVIARTLNQQKMVESIEQNDVVFAVGPAGTGKTYTAVALAVRALKNKEVKKIILTRPAVEAGESLGFLPGDLKEKIDPYLRPLYDALEDMIPLDKLRIFLENRTIEIAPLAFMRGRTLNNCFIILDEAQNTTDLQLKMFLTRMGKEAKVIVTGDLSQVDLPQKQKSGLKRAIKILTDIEGIKIIHLNNKDVLRHKLVVEILKAYEAEGIVEG
ncbi:MAG: PhoH family protein [Bacteroidetes bacterium]|nr:PhoH family protein [Bacteroidota bacterium]